MVISNTCIERFALLILILHRDEKYPRRSLSESSGDSVGVFVEYFYFVVIDDNSVEYVL